MCQYHSHHLYLNPSICYLPRTICHPVFWNNPGIVPDELVGLNPGLGVLMRGEGHMGGKELTHTAGSARDEEWIALPNQAVG